MKRSARFLLLVMTALLLLAAAGGGWLLGTTGGARWFFRSLSRWTPLRVSAEQVSGCLAGPLELQGVRFRGPRAEGRIAELNLEWRPLLLLAGHLAVTRLTLRQGALQLPATGASRSASAGSGELHWPLVGGVWRHLQVTLDHLELRQVRVRREGSVLFAARRIALRASFLGGVLRVSRLQAQSRAGRLTGRGRLDLIQPGLQLELRAHAAVARAGRDHFTLRLRLAPALPPKVATGHFAVTAEGPGKPPLHLRSDLALAMHQVRLRQLRLTAGPGAGKLSGEGEWRFGPGGPQGRLALRLAGVDLAPLGGEKTRLSGTIRLRGGLQGYRGSFTLGNKGADWRQGRLSGQLRGDRQGLTLEQLRGHWLAGTVQGDLQVAWEKNLALSARLEGTGLDPARVFSTWPGQVNLRLQLSLRHQLGAPLQARLQARLLHSSLRGRSIQGHLTGTLQGEDLRIESLAVQGPGFALRVRGALRERLETHLRVTRLADLLPGARGHLQGDGWLRWRQRRLAGDLTLLGGNLAWRRWRLSSLDLRGREEAAGMTLRLSASGLEHGRMRLRRVSARLAGTMARHRLRFSADWPGGALRARVAGVYAGGVWRGTLQELAGTEDRAGRWRLQAPAGLTLQSDQFALDDLRLASSASERLTLAGRLAAGGETGEVRAVWHGLHLDHANAWLAGMRLAGSSSGTLQAHWQGRDLLALELRLSLSGSWAQGERRLAVRRAQLHLSAGQQGVAGDWSIEPAAGGRLAGNLSSAEPAALHLPGQGKLQARWRDFPLNQLNPWLPGMHLAGHSSGQLRGGWGRKGLDLTAGLELGGSLQRGRLHLAGLHCQGRLRWQAQGLDAKLAAHLDGGGEATLRLSSPLPGRMSWPEVGTLHLAWQNLPLALLRPYLPQALLAQGRLGGHADGGWGPAGKLNLQGEAAVEKGRLKWRQPAGEVTAQVQKARLAWNWQGAQLQGTLELKLAEYGQARGSFSLPLPARFPTALAVAAPLQAKFSANLREKGLLGALFPAMIQESHGQVDLALQVGGTWQAPQLSGTAQLSSAGGYLPSLGINLQKVALQVELAGREIRLSRIAITSGAGTLQGSGMVHLQQWRLANYELKLKGKNFQLLHLPEKEVLASPDLVVRGSPGKVSISGEVKLPRVRVTGVRERGEVRASPDAVVVDVPAREVKKLPFALDLRVKVVLGEHVTVKMMGIDARLGGEVLVRAQGLQQVTASGEIHVVQGTYAAYGIKLDISRGKVYFAGGPVDRPTLDILAVRKVQDVQVGVSVSGTPRQPLVKLYSDPAMPDTEILSYLVLGHPLGSDTSQANLLMVAANALLSRGESASLQDQLKNRLGLDVLSIQSGTGTSTSTAPAALSSVPSVPVPAAAAAAAATRPSTSGGAIASSVVTVGKYLTPQIYVSYGYSVFSRTNVFHLRYDLSRHWQVQSTMGTDSGVDLFYKINLD